MCHDLPPTAPVIPYGGSVLPPIIIGSYIMQCLTLCLHPYHNSYGAAYEDEP